MQQALKACGRSDAISPLRRSQGSEERPAVTYRWNRVRGRVERLVEFGLRPFSRAIRGGSYSLLLSFVFPSLFAVLLYLRQDLGQIVERFAVPFGTLFLSLGFSRFPFPLFFDLPAAFASPFAFVRFEPTLEGELVFSDF